MFSNPKGFICVDFNCPLSNHSPEAQALTNIFTRLLMDSLNEFGKVYVDCLFLQHKFSLSSLNLYSLLLMANHFLFKLDFKFDLPR